jgi:hypothetical protein
MADSAERVALLSVGGFLTALVAALLAWATPAHAENPRVDDSPGKAHISWGLNGGTPLEEWIHEEFMLPEDCDRLVRAAAANGDWYDNAPHRALVGSLAFCRRHDLAGMGDPRPQYDFVSEEDFSSLPLELIPPQVLLRSVVNSPWSYESKKDAVERAVAACGTRSHCPHLSWAGVEATWEASGSGSETVEKVDADSCHLRDGRFTGEVELKDGTVRCTYDPETNGVELVDVRFRDVDREGTMDVILSVREARDGGSAPYEYDEFVLTRRTPGGPLERVDVEDRHRPQRE